MTPRSIRRAQERKAIKEANRDARIEANQRNAQLSTGPRTEEGKAKVSQNALKTGLTGKTVLLSTDDPQDYRLLFRRIAEDLQPETDQEIELVSRIVDTEWRLRRVPCLEEGIYAVGQRKFADLFPEEEPTLRAALIQAHVFLTYEKQLNNLSIQEARLRRHLEKDRKELARIQAERITKEDQEDAAADAEMALNFQPTLEAAAAKATEAFRSATDTFDTVESANATASNGPSLAKTQSAA